MLCVRNFLCVKDHETLQRGYDALIFVCVCVLVTPLYVCVLVTPLYVCVCWWRLCVCVCARARKSIAWPQIRNKSFYSLIFISSIFYLTLSLFHLLSIPFSFFLYESTLFLSPSVLLSIYIYLTLNTMLKINLRSLFQDLTWF